MNNDFFALSHEKGVGHLQLNRPERMNTMAPAFFPALRDAVRGLDDAGATRALVISSTGKHFSAGMSLEVFAGDDLALTTDSARDRLSFQTSLRKLMDCFTAIDEARFPVICAIQGGCIGGALDLATACDIRLCSADAFFTVQEISIGMAADLGVLQRLPRSCRRAWLARWPTRASGSAQCARGRWASSTTCCPMQPRCSSAPWRWRTPSQIGRASCRERV